MITIGAAIEYYRQLSSTKKEYEKAREVVEDIVLSFNRQLKRETEKLEIVAYKVKATSSKSDKALEKIEQVDKQFHILEPKINDILANRETTSIKIGEIDKKIRDVVTSHKSLIEKVSEMEKQARQLSIDLEPTVKAVIPIKREKALAPLTDTELSVLEILALEDPKTGPEIKDRIRLSREHTARLMKKLYEAGYLERDTSKIPFKYHIKKEMEKFLKKTESRT